jgi:multidrug resistance efflux pump
MKDKAYSGHKGKRLYLRHAAPVAVWLVAVAVVVWLFYQRSSRFETVGIARGQVRQIAANCTGRITKIHAELFTSVKEGQPLVVVDTVVDNEQMDEARLRTELARAGAEAERLLAQLIPTQEQLRADAASLEMNQRDSWRRFETDVDGARLRILDLQVTLASLRITAEDLAVQVKRSQELLREEAIVPFELERVRVQHEGALQSIRENEQLLAQARAVLQQAEQRRAAFAAHEFPKLSEDAALEAIRKQIGVQERIMRGLLEQLAAWQSRRKVELVSPINGIVIPIHGQRNDALVQRPGEEILRREGEVVRVGDPILAVAEAEPNEIIAYVSEQQFEHLREQMPVALVKTRMPAKLANSVVLRIGPTIELMPQRLWANPTIPQWGRPVLIRIPPELGLVQGEMVRIRGL